MMTVVARTRAILDRVDCDWSFIVGELADGAYLQPTLNSQHGRKWYISAHMTEAEVLQTALLAVLTANEHEVRETFLVDGRAIFGPHFSIDALKYAVDLKHFVYRAEPQKVTETRVQCGQCGGTGYQQDLAVTAGRSLCPICQGKGYLVSSVTVSTGSTL